jgi:hypothetical protein
MFILFSLQHALWLVECDAGWQRATERANQTKTWKKLLLQTCIYLSCYWFIYLIDLHFVFSRPLCGVPFRRPWLPLVAK